MRCAHWIGGERRVCGRTDGVREYVVGARCPAHTPAALAGQPDPGTAPPARAAARAGHTV